MSNEFIPLNKIERGLIEAKKGEITLPKLIDILISEKLFMSSVDAIGKNGIGFSPLIFDRNGISMAAIFTDKSRMDMYKSKIKDVMIISFEDLLKNIPENYGIVINPGYLEGLELLPQGIKNIRRDFLAKRIVIPMEKFIKVIFHTNLIHPKSHCSCQMRKALSRMQY